MRFKKSLLYVLPCVVVGLSYAANPCRSEEESVAESKTEQTLKVAQVVNPESTAALQLAENKQKLNQPLRVELKATQTVDEAILAMAKAVKLDVEFEGLIGRKTFEEIYSKTLGTDVTLESQSFQDGLNDLSQQLFIHYSNEYQAEFKNMLYEYLAIPTEGGVLIANVGLRIFAPSEMSRKFYDVSFYSVQTDQQSPGAAELIDLLTNQIHVYWRFADRLFEPISGSIVPIEQADNDMDLRRQVSHLQYLPSVNILIITAPRSVHYEVETLFELIREAKREQPAPPIPQPQPTYNAG
ncbi:hypothetical protein Pla110_09210 [Polystyrenella longa]|uniref:Uncharacterized protein n=1 Tax=Polystyrenella longa TaxID=2528007 RepID=A0A518CJ08_9PLAN|nr:hypothetical protein [Polystyrenella longa]QDU79216.1 hypothetical protein Pla110_09210 [Polystyrenella longa]